MAFIPFPSGTILAFAGTEATVPSGWLLCNGTDYAQTDYPELYSVITTTYNTQTNPVDGGNWTAPTAGRFRVPDYRASFLRNVGTPHFSIGGDAVTLGNFQTQKTAKNSLAVSAVTTSVSGNKNQLNAQTGSGSNTGWLLGVLGATSSAFSWSGHSLARGGTLTGGNGDGSYPGQDHSHAVSYSGTFAASGTTPAATVTGDTETRPHNRGVNYIIKI